jgi:hypothetical protein
MSQRTASYGLYGLALRSTLALPCRRLPGNVRADVRLSNGNTTEFASARAAMAAKHQPPGWFCCCRLSNGSMYLRWTETFEFLVSADGRRILYRPLEHATRESLSVYLLGQVLSFSLLAFGIESLHSTAVVIDGAAVAFLGDCGYGKSTLAAALLTRGYPVLTDDVMAIEERTDHWTVHPGMPRLKLFPSVTRALLGAKPGGTPMNHGTPKLVLPLGPRQSVRRRVPLKALYVLSDPARRRIRRPPHVQIEPLAGREAFLEIIRGAFNLANVERERLANQFRFATRLVATVPVRRLTYTRDLSFLPKVCDAVLADLSG